MHKFLLNLLTCFICAIFLPFSIAFSSTFSNQTEALVLQHIDAIGGFDALRHMESISRYGKIDFYNQNKIEESYCYHTDIVYPQKLREQIVGKTIIHDRGTNGTSYWLWTDNQYEFTKDPQIEVSMHETAERANRDLLWVVKEIDNYALSETPIWAPNYSQCIQQIEEKDLLRKIYCFDNTTGLLNALGTDKEYRLFSKWKQVGNVKIPFQLTHYKNKTIAYKVRLDYAVLNKPISDKRFLKPESPDLSCDYQKY